MVYIVNLQLLQQSTPMDPSLHSQTCSDMLLGERERAPTSGENGERVNIFIWYVVRSVHPMPFVALERLTKNARKYFISTLLSTGCKISLETRLGARCRVHSVYVAS